MYLVERILSYERTEHLHRISDTVKREKENSPIQVHDILLVNSYSEQCTQQPPYTPQLPPPPLKKNIHNAFTSLVRLKGAM